MARSELAVFTNMCMITDGEKVLVQDRKDPAWPGITFPGGHVEKKESFVESVIREVCEETGLRIEDPVLCGTKQFQDKQQSYSVGMRVWPWHIWSGWWFAGKIRYQEYNTGGIISPVTEEGDRFGAGLYSGYTQMLTPSLNIEFGVGLWGGMAAYRKYECPVCGPIVQEGNKFFIRPDDIIIALVYVF
jgi:8-oxo-dGTP pyrophosphatase MutT (NUDIX family)